MNDIQIRMKDEDDGAFVIEENNQRIAEMVFDIDANNLTIYHTEVSERLKGQGIASKLLLRMADFAREKGLTVVPLCPFVHAQFKKDPELYQDIWEKTKD